MMKHLQQAEIAQAMLGMLLPERKEHLEWCQECRTAIENACTEFIDLKRHAHVVAERSESFWARQRLAIAYQIDAKLHRRHLNLAWALATAAVLAFTVWIGLGVSHIERISTNSQIADATPTVSDEALLQNVQLALDQDVPSALEPGKILTQEMRQSLSKYGRRTSSEATRRIR